MGFTLIELSILSVMLGAIVAIAGYEYAKSPPAGISGDVAADQALAEIQYAQMREMAYFKNGRIVFKAGSSYYQIQTCDPKTITVYAVMGKVLR